MPSRTIEFRKFHAGQKSIYAEIKQHRRNVLRCGRRWGKTTLLEDIAGNWALPLDGKRGLKIGWFSPTYKLLLPSYKRILRTIRPMVLNASKIDTIIEVEGGGQVEFWTLGDEDAGRSRDYDVAIVDEGSLVKKGLKDIWQKSIEPTLLDRRGIGIMAGTPKGIDPENFFYEACEDKRPPPDGLGWHEFHAPTRDNPMLDPVGVANLVNEYPPLVYQQEFLAEFVDWSGAAFFDLAKMLVDGQAVPFPTKCDTVYAVLDTAVKDQKQHDGTAVTFFALTQFGASYPLVVLDWDIVQIEGAVLEEWLPSVFSRLNELALECGARRGSVGVFIEDKASGSILLQQARKRGWAAHEIESDLTAMGKEERAISVSGYVFRGMVKLSQHARDKTVNFKGQVRNHLESQVLGFRIGQKDGMADDASDTFTYGLAIGLGDSEGH